MDDFVSPEPHRLQLADGKYVDIATQLNHGQTEDMFERMSPHGIHANRRWVRTAKIVAYVLGWSLTKDGKPVAMSPDMPEQDRLDTIRNMTQERAIEIYEAIEAHEKARAQARAEQKKILNGAPDVVATSPSPSAVAGESTGSVS